MPATAVHYAPGGVAAKPAGRRWTRWAGLGLVGVGLVGLVGFAALVLLTDVSGWSLRSGDEEAFDDEVSPFDREDLSTQTSAATSTTEPTRTTEASTTTEPTPSTTTTAPTIDAELPGVSCSFGGAAFRGTITGVEEWVAMRATPALTAAEIDQLPVRSEVAYLPDSVQDGERFQWMEVSVNGVCGWVASKFVKDVAGKVVGRVNAIDYTHRALRGLEPEALYATWTYTDPADPEDRKQVDRAALANASDQLRSLYLRNGAIDSSPDLAFAASGPQQPGLDEGCIFSDFLHCAVILVDGDGNRIGRVQLSYIGDGVSEVNLELP